jgi:hypothetical protein
MREHRAGGQYLDVIDTVVRKLPHFLANFPRTVGFAVAQIPGKLDIGSEAGHGASASGDGDVGAGHEHARTDDVATIDGVA